MDTPTSLHPDKTPAIAVPKIRIRGLNFFYGDFQGLKNISLEIPEQKVTAFIQQLESIGLPAETIAERIHDALTLPNPKVRYHIAPDTMRHLLTAVLPKRMMDRLIAKRLGLMPPAT